MPYIKNADRERLKLTTDPRTAGELNYMITSLILQYWNEHPQNYQTINDIVGAVEGAKLEFNRRVVAEYENQKALENGDVYS